MSDYIFVGDELYHYGVPGMRWGHRKARPVSTERARMRSARAAYKDKAAYKQAKKEYKQTDEYKAKRAKAVKAGAVVAGTALAAYGAYKVNKVIRDKNAQIRIGQELVKANKDINFTMGQFDSMKRGQSNGMVSKINKNFNKYAAERLSEARNDGIDRAASDSLVTAAKNVYENRRKRR